MRKFLKIWFVILSAVVLSGCEKGLQLPTQAETSVPTTVVTVPQVTTLPETEPPTTQPPETVPPTTAPILMGWQEMDGKRYYYQEGAPVTGWQEIDGQRYYFRPDGTMATGKVMIVSTGETRYFTSAGEEVILVNPWNFMPEDYSVELEKVSGYKVAAECADALKQMLADCKKAGHSAVIVSAYRTHSYQAGLFQRRIDRFVAQGYDKETAKIEAAKRVAYPGTSEHELGLAIDIVDSKYQNLNEKQETMPAQKWLMEHCWEYGFILRYPNNKSEATGIIYEPWHYRYVGVALAQELRTSGLCLEEYLESLTTE